MNKYDYAVEAIKIIAEQCTLIKIQFSESVTNLLEKREMHLKLPKIPQKRPPASLKLDKKHSLSSSSDKSAKLKIVNQQKKLLRISQVIDEESLQVYGNGSDSERTFEVGLFDELKKQVSLLKSSKDLKEDLRKVEEFFKKLQKEGIKNLKAFRDITDEFEKIKAKFAENRSSDCLEVE